MRTKATPVGEDTVEKFGGWSYWIRSIFRSTMTQVTFGAATGADQGLQGHYEVYYFD